MQERQVLSEWDNRGVRSAAKLEWDSKVKSAAKLEGECSKVREGRKVRMGQQSRVQQSYNGSSECMKDKTQQNGAAIWSKRRHGFGGT